MSKLADPDQPTQAPPLTADVLAGAYGRRGAPRAASAMLRHLVGEPESAWCGRVRAGGLSDQTSAEPPTCKPCLAEWKRRGGRA